MRGVFIVLAAGAWLAACADTADRTAGAPAASSAPPAAEAPVPIAGARPRVVFLGDSLTAGYGLQPSQSVPSLIQVRLEQLGYPHEVVNAGVSGDTSAGGLRRLEWSLEGDVDVLVVELGANDGLRGLPVDDLRRNLADVIAAAQARGVRVLLTGMEAPPNYGPDYTASFRQVYRDLADTPGVTFMPFYLEGVAGDPTLNLRDGIHPNPEGARIVEQNVWRSLEPLLEKRSTR